MPEDLPDHRRVLEAGDDLDLPPARLAGLDLEAEDLTSRWKWIFRFSALPKRWIRLTAGAANCFSPALGIRCVLIAR